MSRILRFARLAIASSIVLTGCTALIGVHDIFLDDAPGGGGDEGGLSEAGKTDGPPGSDAGTDGGACVADLQTSVDHCGRCGHSCLGGDCTAGVCQPTTFLGALKGPQDVAFDATYVYVSSYGDGTIKRQKKDGSGTVETILSGWEETSFIAVVDNRLYWTSDGFHGTGTVPDGGPGNDSFGGVWSCDMPACKDKKQIGPTDVGRALFYRAPYLYSASQDDLRRFRPDGSGTQILNANEQVTAAAVDDKNIYYGTPYQVARYQLDGGGQEMVASVGGSFGSSLADDELRVYWTYYDDMAGGFKGYLASTPKSAPGSRILYGDTNVRTLAAAADGTHVWWVNAGTDPDALNGNVLMCPVGGCPDGGATVVLDKLSFPNRVRLDGDAVYFIESGGLYGVGRVIRVAKP